MASSNRFIITDSTWSVTADGTTIGSAPPLGYTGTLGTYKSADNNKAYQATSVADLGTPTQSADEMIINTVAGIFLRFNPEQDATSWDEFSTAYAAQDWHLEVTTTEATAAGPAGTVFNYYWQKNVLVDLATVYAQLPIDGSNLVGSSDTWPASGDTANDHWGDNPTFDLNIGGTTAPPPDASDDSYQALASYLNTSGAVDLQGNTYTIQNAYELSLYGGNTSGIATSASNTLSNGTITGCLNPSLITWTSIGSGVYKGIIDSGILAESNWSNDAKFQMVDKDQVDYPLQQMRPTPSPAVSPYRYTYTSDWIWYQEGGDNDGGLVVTIKAGTTDTIESIQFPNTTAGDTLFNLVDAACDNALSNDSDWDSLTIAIHTYPNVIDFTTIASWNSTTRVLEFTKSNFQYSNYMKFAFSGVGAYSDAAAAASLGPGEYMSDASTGTLYYKPIDDTAMSGTPAIYVPAIATCLNLGDGGDLTFDGLEIFGSKTAGSGNPYFMLGSVNTTQNVTFNNCDVHHLIETTTKLDVAAEGSSFTEVINRAISGNNLTIRNCYFGVSYNKSVLNATGGATVPNLLENNFFSLSATAHGQVLAGYFDSWQNTTVKDNIFYNCKQILSYQPTVGEQGDVNNEGVFEFSNNLVYTEDIPVLPIQAGQTGIAYNGDDDSNLINQKVKYLSNTLFMDQAFKEAHAESDLVQQTLQLTINKHICSETILANNIMPAVRHPLQSRYDAASAAPGIKTGQASLNNAKYGRCAKLPTDTIQGAFGQSDMPDLGWKVQDITVDMTGVFDTTALTPVDGGDWAFGAATDGGELGVRWTTVPDTSDLAALDAARSTDWAATYVPKSYPDPIYPTGPNEIIVANDDKRGLGPSPKTYNDVQAFATVPNQVVAASTFDVEVVSGMIDPDEADIAPKLTRQSDGAVYTSGGSVMLQYPGTVEDSTHVWPVTVSLELGENIFELPSPTGLRTISITRKSAKDTVTATGQADLNAKLAAALSFGSTVDEVLIDFDGADLPTALHGAGVTDNTDRKYWCIIKPAGGRTVQWDTDVPYTSPFPQPDANFIALHGITVGGATQSQDSGQRLKSRSTDSVWIDDCTITAKYDFSYTSPSANGVYDDTGVYEPPNERWVSYNNPGTSQDAEGAGIDAVLDIAAWNFIELPTANGQTTSMYVSGCTFTGCAAPNFIAHILRDCLYVQQRADVAALAGVALNIRVEDIVGIVQPDRKDWSHVDLFQRWGNETNLPQLLHKNLYWAGVKVDTTTGAAPWWSRCQIAVLDKSFENTWSYHIWRDVDTQALNYDNGENFIQCAGIVNQMRMENIFMSDDALMIFKAPYPPGSPNTNWAPTNTHIKNCDLGGVVTFDYWDPTANGGSGAAASTTYTDVLQNAASALNATTQSAYHFPGMEFHPTINIKYERTL